MPLLRRDENISNGPEGQQDQNIINRIKTDISSAVPA